MPAKLKSPYGGPLQKPLYYRMLTPGIIGGVTGAAFGAVPRVPSLPAITLPDKLEVIAAKVPSRVYMLLFGFLLGFSVSKSVGWLRLRALRSLFAYQGWVTGGMSTKTKVWAMLVKFLKGPKPFSTYEFQRLLPRQPLPDLNTTLNTWLEVCSQIESEEEFVMTRRAIELFRKNEGPRLQAHLQSKQQTEVSWLHDYWLNAAYLLSRDSLAIKSNYYNSLHVKKSATTNQIARTATVTHYLCRFAEMIENETLHPMELMNLVPLCMNGYRAIFNGVRLPGEHIDALVRHAGKKHVIVIIHGKFYVMDMMVTDPKTKRKTLMNIKEIKQQLLSIVEMAKNDDDHCAVAALTTLDRPQWAKQRELLAEKNPSVLNLIESAMFHVSLDDVELDDVGESCRTILTGDGTNRWFDKCFTSVTMNNAWGGHNVEHTAIDAMVYVTVSEYQTIHEKYDENGDILCPPGTPIRDLTTPKKLEWNLQGMEEVINTAFTDYQLKLNNIEVYILTCPYGKGFMKKQKLSPDGFIQMSFQLAYYNKYKTVVKTYEPSTHRLFALGRTETVHPISPFSTSWVKSMKDPEVPTLTRKTLLQKAIKHQTKFRLDATIGQGVDRHLLGLYLASRELGMDTPAIFADKAWRLPFILSSSQTPTQIGNFDSPLDLPGVTGGFSPSCPGGYGLSYVTHDDELLLVAITSWKDDADTSSRGFGEEITKAMEEMKTLFV